RAYLIRGVRFVLRGGQTGRVAAQGRDDGDSMAIGENGYRRGVGVMLLNREGKVWVGARIDKDADAWQMPQGGIDKGEEPWATALRELEEETGIAPHLVEKIAECPGRLKYDLPPELRGKL